MRLLCSGQRGLENINDLIRPVKTEIIVADEVFDAICDDCKRFHIKNTARDHFVYSFSLSSASFVIVAASNVTRRIVKSI